MASINFEKKIIYIHVPKTGGTYIQNNLLKYYNFKNYWYKRNDHDLICKNSPSKKYLVENHYLKKKIYHIFELFKNSPHNRDFGLYNYFSTSKEIVEQTNVHMDELKKFKKFCFVRDPYDRFVSGWAFCCKYLQKETPFDIFIQNSNNVTDFEYLHTFMPQYYHIIDDNNNIIVDDILYFDNLEENFCLYLKKNGFNEINHEIEKKNISKHYNSSYYINTQEKLNLINKYIGDDFKFFNFIKYDNIDDFIKIHN